MSARFAGKAALITGGGTGIGAAAARQFVKEGGKVVIIGRREAPLLDVVASCGGSDFALAVQGDVSKLADLERCVSAAKEAFGGLDVLVANAGIEQFGNVENISLDDWRKVNEVNLDGAMLAARAAIPVMRERGGGAIVLVSSVAALIGAPAYVAYLTTKTAMVGLNRSIAYDYGPENIRCNVLCPGPVRTEMMERAIHDVAVGKGVDPAAMKADMLRPYPLRRMAEPEEIATIIAFLASDDSSFVTGALLSADGGGGIVDIGTLQFA